jgi:hypothetical protein
MLRYHAGAMTPGPSRCRSMLRLGRGRSHYLLACSSALRAMPTGLQPGGAPFMLIKLRRWSAGRAAVIGDAGQSEPDFPT